MTKRSKAAEWDEITIGLVDAMISLSKALNQRLYVEAARMNRARSRAKDDEDEWLWFSAKVQDALTDLRHNRHVQELVHHHDRKAMQIVEGAAKLFKADAAAFEEFKRQRSAPLSS